MRLPLERIKIIGLGVLVPLVLMGAGQCAQEADTTTSEDDGEPTSLETQAFGGYSTSDEAPAFGLDKMKDFVSDDEVDDPTVDADEEDALTDSGDYDVYWLRMVWGNLKLNKIRRGGFDGVELDWTGSVSLDGEEGALILKRLIYFDEHDAIIEEDDRKLVMFESLTGPHIDGLLIKVLVPVSDESQTITIQTDLLTAEISLADLDKYNEINLIDDRGNGMAIAGLKVDVEDCLEGFMQGKYHTRRARPGGIFRGRFVSETGDINGHLRGHYGVNDEGNQVFFGKYIGNSGDFKGRMRGTYDDGAFEGAWHNRGNDAVGSLSGKYVTGSETHTGYFQGFWEESCTN